MPLIKKISLLRLRTNNKNINGLYYFFKGGAFYDDNNYQKALSNLSLALDFINCPYLKGEILRQKNVNIRLF